MPRYAMICERRLRARAPSRLPLFFMIAAIFAVTPRHAFHYFADAAVSEFHCFRFRCHFADILSAIIIDFTRHYFRYFHFIIITLPRHAMTPLIAFPPLFSLYFVSLIFAIISFFLSPLLRYFISLLPLFSPLFH
jgi:hypothetical protein